LLFSKSITQGGNIMLFTEHAKKRLQQRGFKYEYIDFILDYGKILKKPGNALEVRLSIKKADNDDSTRNKQLIDKCKNKAVLLSNTGCVISLYNLM
jgi:hypothetical protein